MTAQTISSVEHVDADGGGNPLVVTLSATGSQRAFMQDTIVGGVLRVRAIPHTRPFGEEWHVDDDAPDDALPSEEDIQLLATDERTVDWLRAAGCQSDYRMAGWDAAWAPYADGSGGRFGAEDATVTVEQEPLYTIMGDRAAYIAVDLAGVLGTGKRYGVLWAECRGTQALYRVWDAHTGQPITEPQSYEQARREAQSLDR